MMNCLSRISCAFAILLVTGCAGPIVKPTTVAELGYRTKTHEEIMKLPAPKGKIVVSVYKFADQTGQYKVNTSSTSFSTSVTQGATSMLLETLRESKWFNPLEREGLNNLLNERKIIMAKLKADGKEDALPKLYHAPVLLEGGIISYDSNVSTGGLGARYLGISGSTQYQKDQVAIYLRAVDVNHGDIQLAVSTTKSILSEEVQFGVFKFIDTDKLLEGELGYTRNEPPQLCVLEALEKAVLSLIIEGILEHKWELKNREDIKSPVIRRYLEEKGGESPDEVIERFLSKKVAGNEGLSEIEGAQQSASTGLPPASRQASQIKPGEQQLPIISGQEKTAKNDQPAIKQASGAGLHIAAQQVKKKLFYAKTQKTKRNEISQVALPVL